MPVATVRSEREHVLGDDELRTIWAAADKLGYPFGPFFKMAILTLQRRDEVAGMRWSEITDDLSRWTIPGSRVKNGKPHDVQLSEPARAILRSLPRLGDNDCVFTTGRRRNGGTEPAPISGFSQGKQYLDTVIQKAHAEAAGQHKQAFAPVVPWRLHDLRGTRVTKLAELGFDSIVVDKLLAYQLAKPRGVAAIYQRHDWQRSYGAVLETTAGSPA